jgi:hypothetical protein
MSEELNAEMLRKAATLLREATKPKDGQQITMDVLEDGQWYRYSGIWPGPFERKLLVVE